MVSPIPSKRRGGEGRGGGHDPLHPHPRLGEAQVEGGLGAAGELPVDPHQVARLGDLGGEDELVRPKAHFQGGLVGARRAFHQGLEDHLVGAFGLRAPRVLVHEFGEEGGV